MDKKMHTIYYVSMTLDEVKLNYVTTKKDLLVVFFATDMFHYYLVGLKIILYTDHDANKYL